MKSIPDYPYEVSNEGLVFRQGAASPLRASINPKNGYLYVSLWKNNKGKTFAVHRLVAQAYIPNPLNKPEVNHIDSDRSNPKRSNLEWCTRQENVQHGYDFGFMSQVDKRHFDDFELELLLKTFLDGNTLTDIATQKHVGLPRLSINIRRRAEELGLLPDYESELQRQKEERTLAQSTHVKATQSKPILQFTKGGQLLAEYPSVREAARTIGTSNYGSISNAANGKQKTSMGYVWRYV